MYYELWVWVMMFLCVIIGFYAGRLSTKYFQEEEVLLRKKQMFELNEEDRIRDESKKETL